MNVQKNFLLQINNLLEDCERPTDPAFSMEKCDIIIQATDGWEICGNYQKQTLVSVTLNKIHSPESRS